MLALLVILLYIKILFYLSKLGKYYEEYPSLI